MSQNYSNDLKVGPLVSFIGASPGDPELITVKGMKAIQEADIVIYAGSLVSEKILDYARKNEEGQVLKNQFPFSPLQSPPSIRPA